MMEALGDWNVRKVTTMDSMFEEVALSPGNYNHLLEGWSSRSVQKDVKFHAGNSKYSPSAAAARNILISNYNWEITDGGEVDMTIAGYPKFNLGLILGIMGVIFIIKNNQSQYLHK